MVTVPAETVVVPVATADDAERTCDALDAHCGPGGRIVLVHVIEKAGGAPDKASVEQREAVAEDAFAVGRDRLADLVDEVETRVVYATDVSEGIGEAAIEVDADLIAFAPRDAGRVSRLLSGDTALDLVTDSPVPTLALSTGT